MSFCLYPWIHRIKIEENGTQKPPEKIGEYYIVRNHEMYYIGKTVNLKRRMAEHRKSGKLKVGDTFYYRIALLGASQETLANHERKMIEKYKPSGNRSKGGEGRVSNPVKYWFMSGGPKAILYQIIAFGGIGGTILFLNRNSVFVMNIMRFLMRFLGK